MSDTTETKTLPKNTFIFVNYGSITILATETQIDEQPLTKFIYKVEFKDSETGETKELIAESGSEAARLVAAWLINDADENDPPTDEQLDDDTTPFTLADDRIQHELAGTSFIP